MLERQEVAANGSMLLGMSGNDVYVAEDGAQFAVVRPDRSTPELNKNDESYWLRVYNTAERKVERRFRIWDPPECYTREDEPCESNRQRRSRPIERYLGRHEWFIADEWTTSSPKSYAAADCASASLRLNVVLGIYRIVYDPPRVVIVRDDGTIVLDTKAPRFAALPADGCQPPGMAFLSSLVLEERLGVILLNFGNCSDGECIYPHEYLSARLPADGRKSYPELSTPIVPPPPPNPPTKSTLTKTGGETE